MDFGEHIGEGFRGKLRSFVEAASGHVNGFAGRVVHGKAEMHARAMNGAGFGVGDDLFQRAGKPVSAADDAEADAVCDTARSFDQKIFVKDVEDAADFAGRTRPVRGRKCEERESFYSQAWSGGDDFFRSGGSGAVASGAGETALRAPAAVAIG